jgi:hypothetical protein
LNGVFDAAQGREVFDDETDAAKQRDLFVGDASNVATREDVVQFDDGVVGVEGLFAFDAGQWRPERYRMSGVQFCLPGQSPPMPMRHQRRPCCRSELWRFVLSAVQVVMIRTRRILGGCAK